MKRIEFRNIISLVVASSSLGWILGNSISPVVSTVVSGLMTIFIAVLTALLGIEVKDGLSDKKVNIDLMPFAVFCLFIAIGGSIGIYSKENKWLGEHNKPKIYNTKKGSKDTITRDNHEIGFKNEESELCIEIKAHYDKPIMLKELLKAKSDYDIRINKTFLNTIIDSTSLVNYAKSVCEDEY